MGTMSWTRILLTLTAFNVFTAILNHLVSCWTDEVEEEEEVVTENEKMEDGAKANEAGEDGEKTEVEDKSDIDGGSWTIVEGEKVSRSGKDGDGDGNKKKGKKTRKKKKKQSRASRITENAMSVLNILLGLKMGGEMGLGRSRAAAVAQMDSSQYAQPWHGPWDKYIRAPSDKSHILPKRIWRVRGNVSASGGVLAEFDDFEGVIGQGQGDGILIGQGGSLTVEFEENIGGRICFDIDSLGGGDGKQPVVVTLGYSESPWFAGPIPDATGDRQARDLPLRLKLAKGQTGTVCVKDEFIRGAFKYFTVALPYPRRNKGFEAGDDFDVDRPKKKRNKPWVRIKSLWAVCTAYPAMEDGRNYTGYFYSSSDLLNRIWYAGAWTLQLSTINPREGSSLIDYNRQVDHNHSPTGSWYANFTVSNGTSVTTDGAKRDRVVWPGDMFIAVPGIAVSTNDMLSVRNALDVLYDHQYADGSLPYAGPPMGFHNEFSDTYHLHTLLGTFNYVLYSGDIDFLRSRWDAYVRALNVSISKVDSMGLLHVTSTSDWLRPGLTGHSLEASAILYLVLSKSITLATWLQSYSSNTTTTNYTSLLPTWNHTQTTLSHGLARLYCPTTGLFSDNIGARSCHGPSHIDPQDGNAFVLLSGIPLSSSNHPYTTPKSPHLSPSPLPPGIPSPRNISTNLRARWTRYGAPAPEFPNVISPFASGFELLAHVAAGRIPTAVELILLEWGYLLDGPGFTGSTLAEGFRVDGNVQYPAYPSAARNSHAHGWSSGPTSVLMGDVVGIRVTKAGGRGVRIAPRLTRWLAWVGGGFLTGRGWCEVRVWRVREWVVDEGYGDGHGEDEGVGRQGLEEGGYNFGRRMGQVVRRYIGPASQKVMGMFKPKEPVVPIVTNSAGQRMKKTERKGIIVEVEISGYAEEVNITLNSLLQDLWEYDPPEGWTEADREKVEVSDHWQHDLSIEKTVGCGQPSRFVVWLRWDRDVNNTDGDNCRCRDICGSGLKPKVCVFDMDRVARSRCAAHHHPVLLLSGEIGSEPTMLRLDEDFQPEEVDRTGRELGIVDWDVMEESFKTPVYEGWSVERMREEERARERGEEFDGWREGEGDGYDADDADVYDGCDQTDL